MLYFLDPSIHLVVNRKLSSAINPLTSADLSRDHYGDTRFKDNFVPNLIQPDQVNGDYLNSREQLFIFPIYDALDF